MIAPFPTLFSPILFGIWMVQTKALMRVQVPPFQFPYSWRTKLLWCWIQSLKAERSPSRDSPCRRLARCHSQHHAREPWAPPGMTPESRAPREAWRRLVWARTNNRTVRKTQGSWIHQLLIESPVQSLFSDSLMEKSYFQLVNDTLTFPGKSSLLKKNVKKLLSAKLYFPFTYKLKQYKKTLVMSPDSRFYFQVSGSHVLPENSLIHWWHD